jgi:hypothetical protein
VRTIFKHHTPFFFTLASASILLAVACSQTSGPAGFAPPAEASSTSGGSAAILSPALRGHAAVKLGYDPRGRIESPAGAWPIVPGTLHVNFSPPLGSTPGASPAGVRLTMNYPPARAAAILAARAPVISVRYVDGRTLRWPAAGAFDEAAHRVTVDLPEALMAHATGVTLALAVDPNKYHQEQPGPRYWDAKSEIWKSSGTVQPGKTTVVLIHGIFSDVESAFPTPRPWQFWTACPKKIAAAQKFQQVLGFDYAWNEPPDKEGARFSDFLKTVVAAKPTSLTIEAHSYGSLVTLAAIPQVGSDGSFANVVTLGGPLPLRGTPLAKPENHWRIAMMLGLLAWYYDVPPSMIDRAYDSGMVASLATNSEALKTILSGIKGMSPKPHFVEAAGTKWICFIPGIRDCSYSEETFKKVLVDGSGVQLPWDGVVETIAANSDDIPAAVATPFPLSHIDLQCDDSTVKWVSKQLQ